MRMVFNFETFFQKVYIIFLKSKNEMFYDLNMHFEKLITKYLWDRQQGLYFIIKTKDDTIMTILIVFQFEIFIIINLHA